jgi:hypothetical protein
VCLKSADAIKIEKFLEFQGKIKQLTLHELNKLCASLILKIMTEVALTIPGLSTCRFGLVLELEDFCCYQISKLYNN